MYDRPYLTDYYITDTVYRRSLSEFAPKSVIMQDSTDTPYGVLLATADSDTSAPSPSDAPSDLSEDKQDSSPSDSGPSEDAKTDIPETTDKDSESSVPSDSELSDSETVTDTTVTDTPETETTESTEEGTMPETETATEQETMTDSGTEQETESVPEEETEAVPEMFPDETLEVLASDVELTTETLSVLQSIDTGIQTISFTLSGLFFVVLFQMLANYTKRIFQRFIPDNLKR